MTVVDYLDISAGSVMAITGCGGKTSLMLLIAEKLRDKKVLVTTTTQMFPVKAHNVMLCETLRQCEEHEPQTGIQCLGLLNKESGKLGPLPGAFLEGQAPRYDVMLLEADGSRGLPCKGWLKNEPVVPHYCTHTVGVVTMNALGRAATETVVHRLPEFLALTGLKEGEAITPQALEAMVCAPAGMYKNSAGRQYLLINQAEGDAAVCAARSFLRIIQEKYPNRFERLLYGSVHQDAWQEVCT
jgi:probable selenium-dependent hydroxylase accessory protein YqeC